MTSFIGGKSKNKLRVTSTVKPKLSCLVFLSEAPLVMMELLQVIILDHDWQLQQKSLQIPHDVLFIIHSWRKRLPWLQNLSRKRKKFLLSFIYQRQNKVQTRKRLVRMSNSSIKTVLAHAASDLCEKNETFQVHEPGALITGVSTAAPSSRRSFEKWASISPEKRFFPCENRWGDKMPTSQNARGKKVETKKCLSDKMPIWQNV